MIPSEIMDKIIRVPDEEEETEAKIEELKEAGFVITNFSKGGVFYILLRIAIHIGVQLKQLAVDLINSAFMKHCPDDWVEIRAADYSKTLDEGEKTEGYLTITRKDTKMVFHLRMKRVKYWDNLIVEVHDLLQKWRDSDADRSRRMRSLRR